MQKGKGGQGERRVERGRGIDPPVIEDAYRWTVTRPGCGLRLFDDDEHVKTIDRVHVDKARVHAFLLNARLQQLPVQTEQINRVSALFKRSYRSGFAKQINDIVSMVDKATNGLFGKLFHGEL